MKPYKTLASCKNLIHKPLGMSKRQRKRHRQRQRKRQRRSTEGFDVPEDVLLHIFYRLPLKSLVRFKSVDKEWSSLISNPHFLKSYRTRKPGGGIHQLILANHVLNNRTDSDGNKNPLFGLYSVYNHGLTTTYGNDPSMDKLPLILLNRLRHRDYEQVSLRFMGSYNGLVAIFVLSMTECNFVLWNPLISEHITCYFPKEGNVDGPNSFARVCFLGLCYDSSSDAYVAVVARRYSVPVASRRLGAGTMFTTTTDVHLVNFKTGEFTKAPYNKYKELGRSFRFFSHRGGVGTVVCGVPHWVTGSPHCKPNMIIYFSLEEKGFRKMEVPGELGNGKKRMAGLGSVDGERQLSVVLQCPKVESFFEVWVMKEYGNKESWTNLFVIQGGVRVCMTEHSVNPMCVLGLMENGEYLIKVNGVQLWGYDPEKVSSRQILIEDSVLSIIANEPSLIFPPQPRAH